MTDDDEQVLADLRHVWHRADPPPAGLVETMIAAVAATGLDDDLELLVLVRDSAHEPDAQLRGPATARVLYFRAVEGWTLDAEIDGDQVRGQLLDFDGDLGSVLVTLETRTGGRVSGGVDAYGYFVMPNEHEGWIRFTVTVGGHGFSSRWVEM